MNPKSPHGAAPRSPKSSRLGRAALCQLGLLLGLLGQPVLAQAPAATSEPTPAQLLNRSQSLLAQSQSKAAAIQADVLALDQEIDARVAEIVTQLTSVQDSTDSNTAVMNTKKAALESLKKWVERYAQERGRRLGQIQSTGSAAAQADLHNQVANIDAEMNVRVDQIVALAASMNTRAETERYDSYVSDFGVAQVEREEYRTNQRQISRADQSQSQVAEDLEKAIAGIERDLALVPQRLPRDQQETEIARLQILLAERRSNLQALANASPSDAQRIGDRQADQLARDLRFAQEDIRALWSQLLAKANLLAVERQRVRQLEARVQSLAAEIPPASEASATPPPAE